MKIELIFKIFDTYGRYIQPFWCIARLIPSLRTKIGHLGKHFTKESEIMHVDTQHCTTLVFTIHCMPLMNIYTKWNKIV